MGPPPRPFTYPFAASPDIIRSHQKDAYFSGVLLEQLSTLLRKLYGARLAHTYLAETRVSSELLYLGLTTLIGNRTLGEEYTDIVHVEAEAGRLPALGRRAGYILFCVLGPYVLNRVLPRFRRRVRAKLQARVDACVRLQQRQQQQQQQQQGLRSKEQALDTKTSTTPHALRVRIYRYLLDNLDTITSPSPIYALSLAAFYFSGSYYHISKRIWGLRYIFTRRVSATESRAGYEVLGVLLVLQMAAQGYLHIQGTLGSAAAAVGGGHPLSTSTVVGGGAEISLEASTWGSENLLSAATTTAATTTPSALQHWTHTPPAPTPRFDLAHPDTLAWIPEGANRKCTLCLESMRDPSVTTCGHVFCWTCVAEWVREKPECPLCRQTVGVAGLLVLRG